MIAQLSAASQGTMLPAHPRLPSPTALPQRVQLHTRPPVASRAFLGNRRHIPPLQETTTPGSRGQTAESTERGPGGPHATSSRDGQNGASVDSFGSNGNGNAYSNGNGNGASASQSSSARSSTMNGNGNGNGNGALLTSRTKATGSVVTLEGKPLIEPCDAGHLETYATDRIMSSLDEAEVASSAAAAVASSDGVAAVVPAAAAAAAAAPAPVPATTAGTPYASPGGRWAKTQQYSTFQRTWQIWSFAFLFFFKYFLVGKKWSYGKGGMTPSRVVERKATLAIWLREGLVKLGPTFIKIGQQFSTRVDVLSPEFVQELEKLQDNVPAFDSKQAIEIVERNLGGSIAEKFDSFNPQPIAAASLGQVHLAQINGEKVVVKVQRPGLKSLFDIDLKNVRVIAQWLQKVDPQNDGAARDWVAIYDECSRILYQEIDYRLEGANADRFRENFAGTDWIKVPKIMWEYSTSEVLTMEYCPGIKINRVAELDRLGIDRTRLARLSVESYLQQLLRHGFFHADPHPGNIAVDAEGGGRLIYYDFGMMGSIPNDVRGGLLELFYGVYEKDPDRCLSALVTMGVLIPGNDMTAVRRTAAFFLQNLQERLDSQRAEAAANAEYSKTFKGQASKEEKTAKRKQILSNIGEDLLLASADKPFRFPATFTFVVRSFTVLDGIGKGLNPRFDISEIAAPYARSLLMEGNPQFAKIFTELSKGVSKQNRALKNLFRGPNLIDDVATTVRGLERGDIKLRVRALEAERALSRVMQSQKVTTAAVVASAFVNAGTVLSVGAMGTAATAAFVAAGLSGLFLLMNWFKLSNMEKKEARLTGAM